MHVYLKGRPSRLADDSRNLFALRWDLRLGLFDQAGFVIVPKLGKFVVHFLELTNESAQHYHNVHFDHKNTLSHEALYARFAWALMKIVKSFPVAHMKRIRLLTATDTDGGGDDRGGDENGGGDEGDGKGRRSGRGHCTGGNKGGGRGGVKRKREDENEDDESREDGSQLMLGSEAQVLEEDMKTAAQILRFFVDPKAKASARQYENITWYPGCAIVDRRKQAYFDAHPQIRAHSGQLLPDDYNSSDDENLL